MTARATALFGHGGGADIVRWSLAAAVVATAHAGLMAGYLLLPPQQPQGAPVGPAVIVELAPLPVAPESPADLAPGPQMMEAQAPSDPAPPIEPPIAEPIPKIETPAEVMLPRPVPKPVEAKPEQNPPEIKKPEPVRAERKPPAPRTTASPRSNHRTAPVARAPSPGSAASRAAVASWQSRLIAHLQRSKRYPSDAQSRGEQGVVRLSFTVNRNGRVLGRRIVRSSGHSSLDREVLAMIARAQPLPAFPAAMTQSQINLTVPIRFSMR